MTSSGRHAAGYRFINIHDGFFGGRDVDGKLFSHESKFSSGMKALADYIRSRGLKPGVYSEAGANTCGSHWDNDARGIGVGLHEKICPRDRPLRPPQDQRLRRPPALLRDPSLRPTLTLVAP